MQESTCILSSNYNLAFLFYDKCFKDNALRTLYMEPQNILINT